MKTRLHFAVLLSATSVIAQAQCTIDLPNDTVTIYYGYDPMACTTLEPAVIGAAPTQLLWSNGSTEASLSVCDTSSAWYFVTLTDDTACTATDSVFVNVVDVRCGNNNNKVLVCHVPPGNPANAHTICISENGVPAHLAHGCHLGECASVPDSSGYAPGQVELLVTPNPMTVNASVVVRSGVEQRMQVRVIDVLGRVHHTLLDATLGANESRTLTLSAGQVPTDASMMMIEAIGQNERHSLPVLLER